MGNNLPQDLAPPVEGSAEASRQMGAVWAKAMDEWLKLAEAHYEGGGTSPRVNSQSFEFNGERYALAATPNGHGHAQYTFQQLTPGDTGRTIVGPTDAEHIKDIVIDAARNRGVAAVVTASKASDPSQRLRGSAPQAAPLLPENDVTFNNEQYDFEIVRSGRRFTMTVTDRYSNTQDVYNAANVNELGLLMNNARIDSGIITRADGQMKLDGKLMKAAGIPDAPQAATPPVPATITRGDAATFTSGDYRYNVNRTAPDSYTMSYDDGHGHSGSFKPASLENMGGWFRSNKGNLDDDSRYKYPDGKPLDAVTSADLHLGTNGQLNQLAGVPVPQGQPVPAGNQPSFWQRVGDAHEDWKKNHAPTPVQGFSAPNG